MYLIRHRGCGVSGKKYESGNNEKEKSYSTIILDNTKEYLIGAVNEVKRNTKELKEEKNVEDHGYEAEWVGYIFNLSSVIHIE